MYLKEILIRIWKIKNVLFAITGVFNLAVAISVLSSLIAFYGDDYETVLNAKATPACVVWLIVGIILLIVGNISRKHIGNAVFYSRYFEGDLNGKILYSNLAELTGKRETMIKLQMIFYRLFYMKGFKLQVEDGIEQIVLDSKLCTCECKSCGANIEKRIYFTGSCPYCGSSDLFAKVLTNNRFYSITYQKTEEVKSAAFYTRKNLRMRKSAFLFCLCLGFTAALVAALACLSFACNLNNKEYLTEVLFSDTRFSSYALIKADMIDSIIFSTVLIIAMLPLIYSMIIRFKTILVAEDCSKYLSRRKSPFVLPKDLPTVKQKKRGRNGLYDVLKALRLGYLLNCSFEKHDGILKIALAKKIVKDRCPTCAAPIIGAVTRIIVVNTAVI